MWFSSLMPLRTPIGFEAFVAKPFSAGGGEAAGLASDSSCSSGRTSAPSLTVGSLDEPLTIALDFCALLAASDSLPGESACSLPTTPAGVGGGADTRFRASAASPADKPVSSCSVRVSAAAICVTADVSTRSVSTSESCGGSAGVGGGAPADCAPLILGLLWLDWSSGICTLRVGS